MTGVASNVASGAAAIMTFGLSALAQSAFNRATNTDDTDYCALALAGKQVAPSKGAAKPAPAQQQPKEQPKSGVGGALQNLEKGLGGLKGLLGK